jgi:hypothetical protein
MVRAAMLLAAAAQPGFVAAQPAGVEPTEGFARHRAEFAVLLGRPQAEVRAALLAMPGLRSVRAGGRTAPMTQDYRPDRATVLLDDHGRAVRITCG